MIIFFLAEDGIRVLYVSGVQTCALPIWKLSAISVRRASKRGKYGDGGGLWLQVYGHGSKSWLFRYMREGKPREMGLGPVQIGRASCRERVLISVGAAVIVILVV